MSAKKSLDSSLRSAMRLQVCQQACHELSPDRLSEPAMASLRWCHVSLGLRRLIAAAYGTSFCSMIQPSLRIAFTTSGRLANLRETAAVFSLGWLWVAPPQNLAVQIAQVTSS